jgi:TraI-like C-terminal domain
MPPRQSRAGVGAVGEAAPPPRSRHRLASMSKLQELRADRVAPTPGAGRDPVMAYVSERESKRVRGLDVPKHRVFAGQAGRYEFAGRREVLGCSLVLLRSGEEIFVLQAAQPDKWSRLRVGHVVHVDRTGKRRGRTL